MADSELLGYRVEKTTDEGMPYILHGKRGAMYGLLRNRVHPEKLFPFNPASVAS